MKVFKEPNLTHNWKCPICGTNAKKEVVLVGIKGTQKGRIIEAEQFHLECIDLLYDKEYGLIYQFVGSRKKNNKTGGAEC